MILKESLEILLTVFTEKKSIDSGTQFLESKIGWCKDSSSKVSRCIVDGFV